MPCLCLKLCMLLWWLDPQGFSSVDVPEIAASSDTTVAGQQMYPTAEIHPEEAFLQSLC